MDKKYLKAQQRKLRVENAMENVVGGLAVLIVIVSCWFLLVIVTSL